LWEEVLAGAQEGVQQAVVAMGKMLLLTQSQAWQEEWGWVVLQVVE
jgi:hypothetical protein